MADNTVTVIGNLVRDPELRFTASGQAIVSTGIAVNRRWQNKQTNEWDESVSFFDVTAWGGLGENVANSLVKGNRVVVTGRLEQRSWEDQEGNKRTAVSIVADDVAPSLRWATCTVARNERTEGGQTRQQSTPAAPAQPDPNEEPF